jgi:hypothetical protein
MGVSD